MKQICLFTAVFMVAATCFAQTDCGNDNPLFRFNDEGQPKRIHELGSAPEFSFLRNMGSARQVYSAIKRTEKSKTHRREMAELNGLLAQIGFPDGARDLKPSSITMKTIPSGTVGNMGSRGFKIAYARLSGNRHGFKAWKITSENGCYVYLMAKCGNAFFPEKHENTACPSVPLNLDTQPKEVTVNEAKNTTDKVYVYYHVKGKKHRGRSMSSAGDIPDNNPSRPLLLSKVNSAAAVPETYKISVSTNDNTVKVCPDKPLDVEADINVEKTPGEVTDESGATVNKEYKMVSKRAYKIALRKMRKVKRKEERIASLTDVKVNW